MIKRKEGVGLGTCATSNISVSGMLEDRPQAREAEPIACARHAPGRDALAAGSSILPPSR